MEIGNIVEYIENQKIICAVVIEIKSQRLKLLTESNKEVKLGVTRLAHKSKKCLNIQDISHDKLIENLKNIASQRKELSEKINIKEIWEIVNCEQNWIDLATITGLCFPNASLKDSPDFYNNCESAIIRAFFKDRLYFKFDVNRFFPNSQEQIDILNFKTKETEQKQKLIDNGSEWLKFILAKKESLREPLKEPLFGLDFSQDDKNKCVELLKSFYLFDREAKDYNFTKEILAKALIGDDKSKIFQILVDLKVWNQDENTEIIRLETPVDFSEKVSSFASSLDDVALKIFNEEKSKRKDFTHLELITIDGQSTLDFDDAISIEIREDCYFIGVHISDVSCFIKKEDILDQEALLRGSSIYLPDQKIPMLPICLSENLCSLKLNEIRPAISVIIKVSNLYDIISYNIYPSFIKIKKQLTYHDVNAIAEEDKKIIALCAIAKRFRNKRLTEGAMQICLPEVNVWLDENKDILVSKTVQESLSRMLVTELMIMANWLMASFLVDHKLPAIYRSQMEPKERLYKNEQGSLFQHWMQRKFLSKFSLNARAEKHCGVGLSCYVTATSPIRKYFDLVTQRQIKSIFELEKPYSENEINIIIRILEDVMNNVQRLQQQRKKYWLLKYLERKVGKKEEAIVLGKRKNNYLILITEYMLECELSVSPGILLKPEDLVHVVIQHVNARRDLLSVFIG